MKIDINTKVVDNSTKIEISSKSPKINRLNKYDLQKIIQELLIVESGTLEIKLHNYRLTQIMNHRKVDISKEKQNAF